MFSGTLCASSFYNISSALTEKCSWLDRYETFKNVIFPKSTRIFPSPNSVLRFRYLFSKKVKTGHINMAVSQYALSLMEIENKNVIDSLIHIVTEIKQTVQSWTSVSVVNNTHHVAQNLYAGKIFKKPLWVSES